MGRQSIRRSTKGGAGLWRGGIADDLAPRLVVSNQLVPGLSRDHDRSRSDPVTARNTLHSLWSHGSAPRHTGAEFRYEVCRNRLFDCR